ncbi:MAG: hypothetical protein Harvfovirus75_3 [Harvfovirus sp.]|uniref:Uncharacterized protein n=1 Tax=Harvfovirus sp. TaxID=2487768 RepID=A0A3G5A3V4_9VIRU|nr:MAG: hypothetical protein Harvfovirus75_3 [Harvfovirus sp.]
MTNDCIQEQICALKNKIIALAVIVQEQQEEIAALQNPPYGQFLVLYPSDMDPTMAIPLAFADQTPPLRNGIVIGRNIINLRVPQASTFNLTYNIEAINSAIGGNGVIYSVSVRVNGKLVENISRYRSTGSESTRLLLPKLIPITLNANEIANVRIRLRAVPLRGAGKPVISLTASSYVNLFVVGALPMPAPLATLTLEEEEDLAAEEIEEAKIN